MFYYVNGMIHMFSDDYHKTILEFNSVYAIRIYEIIWADRFFHKDADPEYEIADLRYWLDCEKKYLKTNDFCKCVIEVAAQEINRGSDSAVTPVFVKKGRSVTRVRFEF